MKKVLLVVAATAVSANAAITIGGTAITNARNGAGSASVPSGSLALLIVDSANNGFFNLGSPTNGALLDSTLDPILTPLDASLAVGQTFGGELILARLSTGTGSVSGLLTDFTAAPYLNRQFAVVWFDGLTSAGGELSATAGTKWGVVRGSDWVFPPADVGTFTMSSTDASGDASFYQVNANVPAANAAAFRTVVGANGGAAFTIVPEPSTALLGALGALGLLRRRRI